MEELASAVVGFSFLDCVEGFGAIQKWVVVPERPYFEVGPTGLPLARFYKKVGLTVFIKPLFPSGVLGCDEAATQLYTLTAPSQKSVLPVSMHWYRPH